MGAGEGSAVRRLAGTVFIWRGGSARLSGSQASGEESGDNGAESVSDGEAWRWKSIARAAFCVFSLP